MVLQGMFNKLAKQEDAEKYARFALRAYVEGSKKVNFLHNYLEGSTCLYCQRYWQFWNHVFSLLHGFVTLVVSCRLNGVQPLTVHARWNLLVMWTMMSHVIANTGFAGMWVLLLPFPIILFLLFFLVIWWFCYIFFSVLWSCVHSFIDACYISSAQKKLTDHSTARLLLSGFWRTAPNLKIWIGLLRSQYSCFLCAFILHLKYSFT